MMTPFLQQNKVLCSTTRRGLFQFGALGALNLAWPKLLPASDTQSLPALKGFGNAKSCVVIFLFGGPGQQDLWDLKPEAPAEVRGEFKPIATNVSGIAIGEHLPLLSQQADKFAIVRSVTHTDFEHGSASYTALTGQPHPLPGTNTPARQEDFPTYGAIISKLQPTPQSVPNAVILGPVMHQGARPPMAGQNAGFLGDGYEPLRIPDDPNSKEFSVSGLAFPDGMTPVRMNHRYELLGSLEQHYQRLDRWRDVEGMTQLKQRAHGLLASSRSRDAFELSHETLSLRDRYGRHRFGQTMLLTRRLVEAEVPLVTINWSKLNADQWDTHKKNYPKLKNELLPPFDQGVAALLADLDDRGLLDTTLVIALGEFGRTPKLNKDAGRDHWPDCYSVLLAGGGTPRGFIYGSSDRHAAYPADAPVAPWDLAATMYHLMGVAPHVDVHDRLERPFRLSHGRVVRGLL